MNNQYTIIDFDNPDSFPIELEKWIEYFSEIDINTINSIEDDSDIGIVLGDLRIYDMDFINEFILNNANRYVNLCHCTRIIDKNSIYKEGLRCDGGEGSYSWKRIVGLLEHFGFSDVQTNEVLNNMSIYWERHSTRKGKFTHFTIDSNSIIGDDRLNYFAINLGGETLRWAIKRIDDQLYKKEPYKRLWIEGIPVIIKFKCKISDIHENKKLIAEIVKYNIVEKYLNKQYHFKYSGMTNGFIPPEDIISIMEIKDYRERQEAHPEFYGFYD